MATWDMMEFEFTASYIECREIKDDGAEPHTTNRENTLVSRLRPELLARLYRSDAMGFQDEELCDEVGLRLYARCRSFALVIGEEVECPHCGMVFRVGRQGESQCPRKGCGWHTTWPVYRQSLTNHYAGPGTAGDAFLLFYRRYPGAGSYRERILLIDALIHSFHCRENTGTPTKSVASKLLEGNKKDVVQFLDCLSARDPAEKESVPDHGHDNR